MLPCMYVPFVAPALTGIAMIDGLPSKTCHAIDFINFGYRSYQKSANERKNICRKALGMGYSNIIVLKGEEIGSIGSVKCN